MVLANPMPSPDPRLTGRRVGRFHVGELLGAGGMGEVYRADDSTLKRPVAIKRVSARFRRDPQARKRILREAERASALNSAHIAAIYDVLEHDDEVLLVMEYVEGETLRRRQQAGPISLPEFMRIAVQCADALAAAHKRQIVHGDIKPENVMLTADGAAKVLDFGLARQLAPEPGTSLVSTDSAVLAGTPGYIAPEMLLGEAADARADIFSLGVVFYEVLARRHPFAGRTFSASVDHTLHDTPPPLREAAPDVPPELERIVAKMLAKDPADRYATSADLLVDLRALERGSGAVLRPRRRHWIKHAVRMASVVLLFLVLVSAFPSLRQQWRNWFVGPDLPEQKNLAVLAFVPAGSDDGARAFSQGLTATLTAKLTQMTDRYPLQVVPAGEVHGVKSARDARSELGVNLVLEGSLHQSGGLVRVVYSLVDARNLRQLRADTITAEASDAFGVEDRVVESVLRSLELEFGTQERLAIARHGTQQPAAYELYLRGRGYLQDYTYSPNVDKAIATFEQAISRDPAYGLAWAGLGESYWHKYDQTALIDWVHKAQAACEKAANFGAGHVCLGTVFNGTGQYEKAAREFEAALQMDSTSDDAYRGLGSAYEELGRIADAERVYRRAIAVRPQYWAGYNWLGSFLFGQQRYDEAVEAFKQVLVVAPDNIRGYANLGGTYIVLGRYTDAIPLLKRALAIRPSSDAYSNLATAYFFRRQFDEAARNYEEAVKLQQGNYVAWGDLAEAYYWAGKRQDAVSAYRRAIAGGDQALKVNPRDASLLGRLGLYHSMLGDHVQARQLIARALTLQPANPDLRVKAAIVALQAGRRDAALQWLARARTAKLPPSQIINNPIFDRLSRDKRFQALLQPRSG